VGKHTSLLPETHVCLRAEDLSLNVKCVLHLRLFILSKECVLLQSLALQLSQDVLLHAAVLCKKTTVLSVAIKCKCFSIRSVFMQPLVIGKSNYIVAGMLCNKYLESKCSWTRWISVKIVYINYEITIVINREE